SQYHFVRQRYKAEAPLTVICQQTVDVRRPVAPRGLHRAERQLLDPWIPDRRDRLRPPPEVGEDGTRHGCQCDRAHTRLQQFTTRDAQRRSPEPGFSCPSRPDAPSAPSSDCDTCTLPAPGTDGDARCSTAG